MCCGIVYINIKRTKFALFQYAVNNNKKPDMQPVHIRTKGGLQSTVQILGCIQFKSIILSLNIRNMFVQERLFKKKQKTIVYE